MSRLRKRTRTFYQYAAVYFVVLFLLSGIIMIGVLRFSAGMLLTLETQSTKNSMQQAADSLEKQYQTLENIAVQIGMTANYRPNMITRGPVYDITLLEGFKQYTNYSPLAQQYFLVYRSVRKIYTSAGNTSYFDYYAPATLQTPNDLTGEMLLRISDATSTSFEYSGSNILMVFPVRFYGYDTSGAHSATLCFAMTREQVKNYLVQVSAGLPEQYSVSIGGNLFFSTDEESVDAMRDDARFLQVASPRGRVTFGALPTLEGWQMLFSQSSSLFYVGAVVCVLLASLIALVLAHFSLRPLEKLIRKYTPNSSRIESEFRQLDSILSNMEQLHKGSRHQLRNHLLNMLLRGGYSEKLIERWSMLGITFDQPVCCVYLIEDGVSSDARDALENALANQTSTRINIYTVEMVEDDNLIVVVNYDDTLSHEEVLDKVRSIAAKYALAIHSGKPVDSPKRLSLSFMSALTASHYDAAPSQKRTITADSLADWMFEAVASGDAGSLDKACEAVSRFLSEDPLDSVLTKRHFYDLISSITGKADSLGIRIERAEIYALVLLPDANMIASDLKRILLDSANSTVRPKVSSDSAAKAIVEYVVANAYDPDINLQDMCEEFGLSADYISSMIKRETGSSFKEYLTLLRIGEARRLLSEDRNLTVNDVALKVGYRKASNFSKKFKEITGVPPSQI